MTTAPTQTVLRHIRGVIAAEQTGQLADGELLERFAARREEAAFAALVRRHGPLVFGVCRRVLHNRHDAEDAFQAAFLALARHAGSVGRRGSLGGWLHRVAYRSAVRARARSLRRDEHERRADQRTAADPLAELSGRELLGLLDEELQRLPAVHREPLLLCYLEGRTRDEAAREMACSLGTLKRRLERAREVLRGRLTARGVALPAALLTAGLVAGAGSAAVPATLAAAAMRAALARGAVPATVAELAAGTLGGAGPAKLRAAVVLLLAVGATILGAGGLVTQFAASPAAAAPAGIEASGATEPLQTAERSTPPAAPSPGQAKEMTVTGRVLGPDGKPVAGAQVAVVVRQVVSLSSREHFTWHRNNSLGRTSADAHGDFRMAVPRMPPSLVRQVRLLAGAPGLGLAWKGLDPKAESIQAEIRLPSEQVVRGRVVDLQGEPVAGGEVHITELTHKPARGEKGEGTLEVPEDGLPFGPKTATLDARGNFTIRGLGTNLTVEMEVRDDRVELHTFTVDTAAKKEAENVNLGLPPGRVVEGRVTYADTGKPVAGTRVSIVTAGGGDVTGNTDRQGRYHINIRPASPQFPREGNDLGINVFPPVGEPYWMAMHGLKWTKGATRQEMDVALPRGVLVRGKITEAGSGKPVVGAYVEYNGHSAHKGVSEADGSYVFAVPARATGPLTISAPTNDYVSQAIGSAALLAGLKGGDRVYYHAVVPLDLKRDESEKQVPIVLRRGVTIKGRLTGPDGKPVKDTILFASEYRPPNEKGLMPIRVRDSRFELSGCDPDKTYRLVVIEHPEKFVPMFGLEALNTYGQLWQSQLLGPQNKLGAVVEVSAKQAAAEPVEVRLVPCGSAKVRFVNGDGKPLARHKPWLQLLVTPGLPSNQAVKEGQLSAEVVTLISQYPDMSEPHAGADGALMLEGLIPGATYRIRQTNQDGEVLKEFTAESGKTAEVTVAVP
jgi:RNA polymerase sigma factor (sigma-70 family)